MMQPLPNLNQAYRLILQEERQRNNHNSVNFNPESAALASVQRRFGSLNNSGSSYGGAHYDQPNRNMGSRNYSGNTQN